MTTDHHAEAVDRLRASDYQRQQGDFKGARLEAAAAQVHATLARDEEQVASRADMRDANALLRQRLAALLRVVTEHVANSLRANDLIRWREARALTQALDTAGHNIDRAVDELLEDLHVDSRAAWDGPSGVAGEKLTEAQARDMRDAIARSIGEALADKYPGKPEHLSSWARNIAYRLDGVGVNIDAAIEARVQEIAPGTPPVQASEMPF